MMAWALGATLAAVAGVLIASDQTLSATTLTLLVVNAYAAAVVGRLRSLPARSSARSSSACSSPTPSATSARPPPSAHQPADACVRAIPAIMLFVVIVLQPEARLRAHGVARPRSPLRVPSQKLALRRWHRADRRDHGPRVDAPAASDLSLVVKGFGFALITLSLVPLTGYAGQISLAQMTFTGIGAVAMAAWGAKAHRWRVVADRRLRGGGCGRRASGPPAVGHLPGPGHGGVRVVLHLRCSSTSRASCPAAASRCRA